MTDLLINKCQNVISFYGYWALVKYFIQSIAKKIYLWHSLLWHLVTFAKQPIYLPGNTNILRRTLLYCLLLLQTQPIQVGELNVVNVESLQQARQPLAPGERELALGEVENMQPEGKEGEEG